MTDATKPATVSETHRVACPDCGPVDANVNGWARGVPACGWCPECFGTLLFRVERKEQVQCAT